LVLNPGTAIEKGEIVATEERTRELIKKLYDAVINMEDEEMAALTRSVLEEGVDPNRALTEGLTAAMQKVGQMYSEHIYFVPELLLCSDALYAGLDVLRPHLKADVAGAARKIIIGTVEGDIHDIGKNLVKIMFESAGWTVFDLGKDVTLQNFVDEQVRVGADVIALSALMTTSMLAMPTVIQMVKAKDPNVAIMVGGAPLTAETANLYGADGYATNAGEAVREANEMLKRLGKK
jgi:methanogenic corrinoid protein MtbC1